MDISRNFSRAYAAYKTGNMELAWSLLVSIIDAYPNVAKPHQLAGLVSMKLGNMGQAKKSFQHALSLAPNDVEILNSLGNFYKMSGQFDKALSIYEKAMKISPNYFQLHLNMGDLHLKYKDPLLAASVFRNALARFPRKPALKKGLIYALKDSQNNTEALRLLGTINRAVEVALTAGQLLVMQGNIGQARSTFYQALNYAPTALQAFRNLVQLEWMQGGQTAAKTIINTIIDESPKAVSFYINGAEMLLEMGDIYRAETLLGKAQNRFGYQPDFDHVRAIINIGQGNGNVAYNLSRKILSSSPRNVSYQSSFVQAALMTGAYQEALCIADNVLTIFPNNQFWIAARVTALRAMGRSDKGTYDYDRLVKTYMIETPPEYEDRVDFLEQLKKALEKMHTNVVHPIGQSLRFGTQTSMDLRFADVRVVKDFFQALEQPILTYLDHIGHDVHHPLMHRNTGQYRLTGAWSVKLNSGGFHVNHVHPEGWISSAFYVDVPDGTVTDPNRAGWIKFGEPPFQVKGVEAEHWVAPTPGLLVLFPSYMWHGTVPINDGTSRMTLPFDAVPV